MEQQLINNKGSKQNNIIILKNNIKVSTETKTWKKMKIDCKDIGADIFFDSMGEQAWD